MRCVACAIRARPDFRADTAFTAGISFAFTFSAEAMKERLCAEHQESLARGHAGALVAVEPADRRAT